MVGKKKGVSGQKESAQTDGGEEGKENRERGGERDVARRRGGAPRRGRGASRGRECKCSLMLLCALISHGAVFPDFHSGRFSQTVVHESVLCLVEK